MTSKNRRALTATLAVGLPALALGRHDLAKDDSPIEWVVGYPAGGGSDVIARVLAEAMSKLLGRPIVVLNKPGAATALAADYLVKAKEKLTVMSADNATLAANPWLYRSLPYKVEDLQAVGLMARFPLLLVVPASSTLKSLRDFVAWAKAGTGTFASAGVGSPHHLAMELLKQTAGVKVEHVPYKGAAPAMQDLAGGQVPVAFMDTAAAQPFLVAGRVRAIGVASKARLKDMPAVQTLSEQGMAGLEAYAWQGLVVPSTAATAVVLELNKALRDALATTAVKARFQALGVEPTPSTDLEMTTFAAAERERWGKLIKAAGIEGA